MKGRGFLPLREFPECHQEPPHIVLSEDPQKGKSLLCLKKEEDLAMPVLLEIQDRLTINNPN